MRRHRISIRFNSGEYGWQIFDDQAVLLPVWETLFKFITRMDRRIVDDHDGLFRERLTKRIKTGNDNARVDGCFKHIGMQIIVCDS